jgi:hypothetical protein
MRIPINAVKKVAEAFGQTHVIILAYDGKEQHVVTYGNTKKACAQAATGGNMVKAAAGWPESLAADPAPVARLKKRIRELEQDVVVLQGELNRGRDR